MVFKWNITTNERSDNMDYCEIEIKANGKVIKTINNIEVYKRTELEITNDEIDLVGLADLQEQVWFELEQDKLWDTPVPEFYDCDNWQELVDFVDKWVCEAFITCLTNYYYKKYKVVSL